MDRRISAPSDVASPPLRLLLLKGPFNNKSDWYTVSSSNSLTNMSSKKRKDTNTLIASQIFCFRE